MELSLTTFALMALIVVMTPGPTVLLALTNGSRYGVFLAGYGILGAALSDAVLIAAAGLGLGAVLAASAFWFAVVKWIGVAYLIWLGVEMLRSSGGHRALRTDAPPHPAARGPALAIFRKCFLVAVTNPKGYLFFTAFLPQFLILSEPLFSQYVTLALVFIAVDVAVMTVYAGLGARAMHVLTERGARWLDRASGGFLVALGLALALVKRSEG